jgi:ribose/xylose/arabinose/galactoside ABC-type transport system permease subunit
MSDETRTIIIFFAMFAVVIIVFSQLQAGFLTLNNFRTMLKHISITAIASLGLAFVIAVGHFDMSFPWVGNLAGNTGAFLIAIGADPVTSVAASVALGLFYGLMNGMTISRLRLPDMVLTIGTGSVAYGLSYLYRGGSFIFDNFFNSGMMQLNEGTVLRIPVPVFIMVVLYAVCFFLLHRTSHGRRFYATGDNRMGAVFSGIKIKRYVAIAFMMCGGFVAISALLQVSSEGQSGYKTALTILMPAYASVFLGISVFRKVTVWGTFLGSALLIMMLNGFTLLNVPFYSSDLVITSALIFALAMSNENVMRIFKRKTVLKVPAPSSEVPS